MLLQLKYCRNKKQPQKTTPNPQIKKKSTPSPKKKPTNVSPIILNSIFIRKYSAYCFSNSSYYLVCLQMNKTVLFYLQNQILKLKWYTSASKA